MKYSKIILFSALTVIILNGCYDEKMKWYRDSSHGEISEDEIPMDMDEKIAHYDVLKSYKTNSNMKLGVGMGMDLYMDTEVYRNLVNSNFEEITVGYAMKHGPMVKSNGELNFTSVDTLMTRLQAAGLSVYGHCLCWHSNQNASYLNSLIADDKAAALLSTGTNLLPNGDFENGTTGWQQQNLKGSWETIALTDAPSGSNVLKIINTNDDGTQYKTQLQGAFTANMEAGKSYTTAMWVKSENAGSFRISYTNDGESNYSDCHYQSDEVTTSEWKQFTYTFTAGFTSGAQETGISLDFGATAGTYYVDQIIVAEESDIQVVAIAKTDEQKAQIIGEALETWISQMVSHYKTQVFAWDVVNEPMKEDGTLRDGDVSDLSDDEFYWVKYLGKDYAVQAFKLARQYGNTTDKLFINDYNLEYSLSKCDGLIEYVQYIESQGAQVDGIGTQMHAGIDSDTAKIAQMFQKLAATGKLIKISELDIVVNTDSPSDTEYAEQANMYQYIIDCYRTIIPESQQYGITIWGISDNAKEHENWLPNDAPNLWDKNYERKQAYKGVADGLAGRDVSLDFSTTLVE